MAETQGLKEFSSVAQLCPTFCDPVNHSMPGLPVHHQLPKFTQTHIHRVGDAIQPSHPLSSPSSPAPNPSQHQSLFQWVNSSHEVAKVLEFQLWHHSFQWTPRADLLYNGLVGSPCGPRDSQESSPIPHFCPIDVVQSLSCVWLFATLWTAARQASLSFTISQSWLKLMSIESVMPSNHLVLCPPLLLLPSIFPSIGVFSNESVLCIRWLNIGVSVSTSVLWMNIQD